MTTVTAAELPIDTTAVFVKADSVKNFVMDETYTVLNSFGLVFLKSDESIAKSSNCLI